jgi:threonine-phosphate decarboxylase
MIKGHGDDTYQYDGITSDFSSNICTHHTHQTLMNHLAAHPKLISHYPEPEAWSLEKRIAEHHGLSPQQVIVTNGATEAIYLIAQTFRLRPVIPTPTFSEYEDACKLFPHTSNDRMLWLCNPNNPTGEIYDQTHLDYLIASHSLTVIDQSYEHYANGPVCCDSVAINLLHIHSMTKTYGVPGLRLGYITAHESLTAQIRQHLRPWSVSSLAIEAGKFLLQHDELICKPDLREAQRLRNLLSKIPGITVMPTQTNFMLCKIANRTAAELKDFLALEHHMLIRDASNFRGLTPHHFRIAAQTPTENDALVSAIRKFMNNNKE